MPETPLQLIDSHCHLQYDYEPKSQAIVIAEALRSGLSHLITVGTDLTTGAPLAALSDTYPEIYFTVGVHPHESIELESAAGDPIETLRLQAAHPKCRAIGEIGLDYYYDHSPREIQQKWLKAQLKLALDLALPIVIHSRDGEADLLPELEAFAQSRRDSHGPHAIPGVIHCFTGTREFGLACLKAGFYISFSGILTFKNAQDLRACAHEFPLERLLVETDSPYLAPVPYRGKKCEPSMVAETAWKLAEIKGVSREEVARVTVENTKRVFKL